MLERKYSKTLFSAFLISTLILPLSAIFLFDAQKLWLVSTMLLSLSCLLGSRIAKSKYLLVLAVFVIQLVNAAYFFSYYLQGEGFNSRFFYHLRLDLLLGGIGEFFGLVFGLVTLLLFSIIVVWIYGRDEHEFKRSYRNISIAFGVAGLFLYSPGNDSLAYAVKVYGASKEGARHLKVADKMLESPKIKLLTNSDPKNIVVLFLESVDSSFYDSEYYPNLLPELNNIRRQSVDFSNVKQVDAASWTIAGMFASLCSLPLHSPFSEGRNTMSLNENFMSGASCLTDLLVENGYVAHYVGGANTEFAGKKSFLHSHGYQSIKGLIELRGGLKNKKYKHGWGLYDDSTYDFAWKEFEKLSQSTSPFFLTMLTLDTHHPKGHASKSCKAYTESGEDNTMLNALHCADQLASQFIKKIRASEYSKNTTVVVLSDHLAMRNAIWDKIVKYDKERKISFFINFPDGQHKRINNPGTQYDIAPTILETAGIAKVTKPFPLGKNLSKGKGLLIDRGIDINFGSESLARQRALTLWNKKIGNLKQGFDLGRDGNLLRIGKNIVSLKSDGWDGRAATLIEVDADSGEIEDVKIWPQHAGLGEKELVEAILDHPEKIYLAIAKYKYLRDLDLASKDGFTDDKRVYFFGSSGSAGNFMERVPRRKWESVNNRAIKQKFKRATTVDPKVRSAYLEAVWGSDTAELKVALEHFNNSALGLDSYDLQSCAFHSCESYSSFNGKKETLERGLNIFGISKAGSVRYLAHIDGCSRGAFKEKSGFQKIRDQYSYFDTWVLVSHDTVGCPESILQLDSWSTSSVLTELPKVKFREPYIALFNEESGAAIEILGNGKNKIQLSGPNSLLR